MATFFCQVSEEGTLNLLSQSFNEYAINEQGLQLRGSSTAAEAGDEVAAAEKTYRCASNEMCVFGPIGSGASSVVCKAIHIPTHRLLALKRINVFEKVRGLCYSGRQSIARLCNEVRNNEILMHLRSLELPRNASIRAQTDAFHDSLPYCLLFSGQAASAAK